MMISLLFISYVGVAVAFYVAVPRLAPVQSEIDSDFEYVA